MRGKQAGRLQPAPGGDRPAFPGHCRGKARRNYPCGPGHLCRPPPGGGQLNDAARAAGDVVKLIELEGEEKLFYPAIPIQVAILRASYADTRGNCTFQREGVYAEAPWPRHRPPGIPAERSSSRWSALWNTAPWTPPAPARHLRGRAGGGPAGGTYGRPSAPVITRPSPARCASSALPAPAAHGRAENHRPPGRHGAAPHAVTNLGIGMPEGGGRRGGGGGPEGLVLTTEVGAIGGIPRRRQGLRRSHQRRLHSGPARPVRFL